jgi:DUF4097 and DUF4098 domain-containing protein YvlB
MPKNSTHLKSIANVVLLTVVLAGTFAAAGALAPQLNVSKMGGDIDYADVPDGGTFKTMGGDIHLGKVHNSVTVTTMGGNISVDSADGSVKAKTMGGNISVRSANASVEATSMGGNVEATLVKGDSSAGHNVTLSSMSGEIILTVPKDYPMTIEVELVYTRGNENKYKITESLGLEQTASKDWDTTWHGSPRKSLYAKGKIGNGQNHVTIKTVNGDVIIKGERSQL